MSESPPPYHPLPCPFCGGSDGEYDSLMSWRCPGCGATGPDFCTSPAQAAGEWNRRRAVLRDPADAPRDGTSILAAVGWPWLVPAVWDEDAEAWCTATVGAEQLEGGVVSRYWETENASPAALRGWLPVPELPGERARQDAKPTNPAESR